MAIAPRLDLRQKQSLAMTPQMQQSIKLLTLSNLELEGYLTEALEKNPLLESESSREFGESDSADVDYDGDDYDPDFSEGADTLIAAGAGEADAPLDSDSDSDVFHHDCAPDMMGSAVVSGGGEDGPDWENMLSDSITLHDHLRQQMAAQLSGDDLLIADYIIGHIDDAGYLGVDTLEIAQQLGCSAEQVEAVLKVVQQCDPSGVGARSLSESMAIQAREADRYDPAMQRLIEHLDLVARRDIARLKRICRVDEEDVIDMIAELRDYDPRPGSSFAGSAAAPVVPDVFVRPKGDGWQIAMNPATLPRLLINRSYHAELSAGIQDKASKAWLNEQLQDANWLIRALDQRQRTITKVTTEIVKYQDGFFREGVAQLKPLTHRQIAEAVEMHESTISRVANSKYLACDRGTFALKYFFTAAIASADGGEAASSLAVKDALKTLIDEEDPQKVLSDNKLVAMLKSQGYDIARRTVVKYREAMNLGSSVQRRREKAVKVK